MDAHEKSRRARAGMVTSLRSMISNPVNFREGKAMTIIPHLAMLGLAAALSSPIHQHQIDLRTDGVQRFNQLWVVTYVNETGQETVAQAKLATGEYAPLIAADTARLESMMPAARGLAKANNLKMRLIKFTNRLDIEDITP
jgi:hypothetical protein